MNDASEAGNTAKEEVIQLKEDGSCVRYTVRSFINAPYPRSYDDTIDEILTSDERQKIVAIFQKHGRPEKERP